MSTIRTLAISTFAIMAASAAVAAVAPGAMAQRPRRFEGQDQREQDFRGRPGATFDLLSINNARVSTAQQTLGAQGYFKARNIQMNGRQYDLWYNSGFRNSCVGFTSMNGWVRDARDFRDTECGFGGPGSGGPGWGGGRGGFDTRDLEGLRVDSAKGVLRDHGFNYVRATRVDGRQYDLWYDRSDRNACVGFTSYNGRVTDARTFRDAECGGVGGGGGWGGRFDLRDLEGLGVDSAKDVLRREGYGHSRNIRIDGRQYDLWYNRGNRNACVGFTSYNGRVTDARPFGDRECY
jgi:hypothetical protein